eukprot:2745812-Rhodomonas_salina.1
MATPAPDRWKPSLLKKWGSLQSTQPSPTMHPSLSVDLVSFATEHIKFLQAVHVRAKQSLYKGPALEAAIREYTEWLPCLDRMLRGEQSVSVPPLSVSWVWHLHKLDPTAYHQDCIAAFGRVLEASEGFNPFHFELTDADGQPDEDEYPISAIVAVTADLVGCARRQSSFLWQVSGPEYADAAFLERAQERYVKFLRLSAKFPG